MNQTIYGEQIPDRELGKGGEGASSSRRKHAIETNPFACIKPRGRKRRKKERNKNGGDERGMKTPEQTRTTRGWFLLCSRALRNNTKNIAKTLKQRARTGQFFKTILTKTQNHQKPNTTKKKKIFN